MMKTDMEPSSNRLVLRDYPIVLWAASTVFVAGAAIFLLNSDLPLIFLLAVILFELPMFLIFPAMTITADRQAQTLTLKYLNPLLKREKVIPFRDLREIEVERGVSSDENGGTSATYRLQAVLRDGTTVPFRSWLSSSRGGKERMARQLNEFIGLRPASEPAFETISTAGDGQVFHIKGETDEALAFEAVDQVSEVQDGDGVRWDLNVRSYSGPAITGWNSLNFRVEDGFLYMVQTMPGMNAALESGALKKLSKVLASRLNPFEQSMRIYGIDPQALPGMDSAAQVDLESRLRQHFMALSSNPTLARQLLNPWTAMPLAAWAEKYPLTQGANNQLVMLISPYGLYLGAMGALDAVRQAELVALGVEIVKSQSTKF